eukprot:Transcript_18573.p1 GENE.Transcript_18573~~Transcript_18573.p1  ORF type:complete len:318 (-),score=114.85 Transcript_18573:169-1122(-)
MRAASNHLASPHVRRNGRRLASTLAERVEVSGVGLHTGAAVRVVARPATAAEGVYFVRSDRPGGEQRVAASPDSVTCTRLSTTLGDGDASVRTVEHLLAALCGAGVTACRVELDGPELPLLDGSAAPWLAAIHAAGVAPLASAAPPARLRAPCWVHEGDSWVVALPAAAAQLAYGLDFPSHAAIGRQWFSWEPHAGSFADEVAPARTFGLYEQLEALQAQGLIKGGTAESAIVCDRERWLTGPLRFANEPARHKLLDLVGDLALLGGQLPCAHVVAWKASHKLHVRLAQQILAAQQQQQPERAPEAEAWAQLGAAPG